MMLGKLWCFVRRSHVWVDGAVKAGHELFSGPVFYCRRCGCVSDGGGVWGELALKQWLTPLPLMLSPYSAVTHIPAVQEKKEQVE